MYRGTYIDAMGRKRREMGYFSLNKPTLNKLHIPVIVQARDKTSAANKINRKYKSQQSAGGADGYGLSHGNHGAVKE